MLTAPLGFLPEPRTREDLLRSKQGTTRSVFLFKASSTPAMSLGFPTLSSLVLHERDVAVLEEHLDCRQPAMLPPGVWFPSASQSMGTTESSSQEGG